MKRYLSLVLIALAAGMLATARGNGEALRYADGTPVSSWFGTVCDQVRDYDINDYKQYVITEYGVISDSVLIQTEDIQAVIDLAAENGGGVVVVPEGTFMTGSLFFKPGVNLHIRENGKLKGIDAIAHYKIVPTRLEGQTIDYFAALVNADGCDGFTISGPGTIDGNGMRFYEEFWLRRKVNPKCTNLEALRPRLVYISNSDNVTVKDVNLINSGFWTNHLYNCNNVVYQGVNIYAPDENPRGPSTDALDLDVCDYVLVDGCRINVGDDAICLKGGKGTYVDTIPGNGPVRNVVVRDCDFGRANAGVTFGSEAWDCSNVILTDCRFDGTSHILLFKMRPDTPQQYRNVLVCNCSGTVKNGVEVQKWTQFFNKVDRDPMPPSGVSCVRVENVDVDCTRDFYRQALAEYFTLDGFSFSNIKARQSVEVMPDFSAIGNCRLQDVDITVKPALGAGGASIIDDRAN